MPRHQKRPVASKFQSLQCLRNRHENSGRSHLLRRKKSGIDPLVGKARPYASHRIVRYTVARGLTHNARHSPPSAA